MLNKKKWLVLSILFVAISLIAFSLTDLKAAELPKAVSIGTHPKGSSFNAIGSGIAKGISLHTRISAVDRPFAGYTKWLPLLNKGEVDMGIVGNVDCYHARQGLTPFKDKHPNLRMISSGTDVKLGYFVRADSGIKTMADFKGKRVIIDPMGAGMGGIQRVMIKAAGLDLKKDLTAIPVAGVTEAVDALIDGRADAAYASVGMGKVKEAMQKVGSIYWVPVSGSADDAAAKIIKKELNGVDIKYYKSGSIPTLNNDAWLIAYPINLVTHAKFSEEATYIITKAISENQKELSPIHPFLRGWVELMVSTNIVLPYHPGAIRLYKEAGKWSDEVDQINQKLLGR